MEKYCESSNEATDKALGESREMSDLTESSVMIRACKNMKLLRPSLAACFNFNHAFTMTPLI